MPDASAPWLPTDFTHPTRVPLAGGLHLRPIRASDVDIDLPAVMGSQRSLWARYGESWGWPAPNMTPEQDYADLDRHEREIARHQSFNYALLNADETALYGCVYLDPAGPDGEPDGAEVSWWVVDDLVGTPAEAQLDALVPRWLADRWPFSSVSYPFNEAAETTAELDADPLDAGPLDAGPLDAGRTPLPQLAEGAATALWQAYCAAHPDAEVLGMTYVGAFGDSVELADELIGLVVRGVKRATASLVAEATEQEPLPRIGNFWVMCDGSGGPRVLLRTVELRVGPVDSVDDAFAWDEGEGDRSRAGWLAAHRAYWQRTCEARGQQWDADAEVVFERFDVVWPPEAARRAAEFAGSTGARPVPAS